MTIKNILVDVDPARDNGAALERARRVAGPAGASIRLHVTDYRQWLAGGTLFEDKGLARSRREYLDSLEQWAEDLAEPLRESGLDVGTRTEWNSSRLESILEAVEDTGADLVIRGATEHSGLNRLLLNATDWELIRRVPALLWLVKQKELPADAMKILAAVDPTHPKDQEMGLDKRILDVASELRGLLDAKLHMFHAYMPPTTAPTLSPGAGIGAPSVPIPPVDSDTLEDIRRMHWDKLTQLAEPHDIGEDDIHMVAGSTVRSIEEIVADEGISLVVTGAIARSWLKRLIIGSTAEAFLDAVDCDVLVVKPG